MWHVDAAGPLVRTENDTKSYNERGSAYEDYGYVREWSPSGSKIGVVCRRLTFHRKRACDSKLRFVTFFTQPTLLGRNGMCNRDGSWASGLQWLGAISINVTQIQFSGIDWITSWTFTRTPRQVGYLII